MDRLFLKLLNMSISASWLVLAVLLLRLLLKKSPKWIHVALWALVAVRLICPISIESVWSLLPSGETIPQTIVYARNPAIDSGVTVIDQAVNTSLALYRTPQVAASVNPVQIDLFIGENLWCLGMVVMMGWAWISYFRLKRKVAASLDLGNAVFLCDYIDTPFILGIIKPKIYLPSSMEPDSASHVLAHERAHIARKDHWWKPFGYLLLTVYWFNPLLWLAYILLCRDIELACDEKVIRDMEVHQKKAYSEALLNCSVSRRHVAACPLAFGEVGVKERVKTVLNYKKPAFWIVMIAILALFATAVCFLTDPKTEKPEVTVPIGESPYTWTSTLEVWDIRKSWSYQEGQKLLVNTIEGGRLDELVSLFNGITEDEIISRQFSGEDDPFWKFQAASMHLLCEDGTDIRLRYVDDLVIIGADTESGLWETDGYWVIENEAMKRWMRSISLGGTEMLSDENRDEIRRLVRQEYVHLFNPRMYDDLLLVGCCYDGGRGLGVAVYEPLADGYRLLELIRGDEVKSCASGSEVYYCDYGDLRIFLVLNQSITGMEWAGAYETSYALDTHPGLLVEYFPENLNTMYRFLYGGGNSTMYMDRNNRTHGQPPEYASDTFADPNDAHSVCANLKLNQVDFVWATEIKTVDTYYEQAFSLELTDEQTVALLNLLRSLPESAFEAVDSPLKELRCLDLFLSNDTGKEGVYPGLRLTLHEEAVYYRFTVDGKTSQSWKIQSPELANYIGSFFGGDTSTWHRFAPVAITEGTVIWSVDKMEITVPQYACFRYELSAEGIRIKPEGEEDWVLIQYRTEPYVPEELGLRRFRENYGDREVVRGCYGDHDEWNFIDFSFTSGDIAWNFLLLNENAAAWVAEYSRQIAGIIGEMNILVKD